MDEKRTLIIAEAGVNHNGDIRLAKRLVDAAHDAGADVVKFQIFDSSKLAAKTARKASYQVENMGSDESQVDMLKKLELTHDEFAELKLYCESVGIRFLATAFDAASTRFLVDELGVSLLKVPSGEINNYPYLVQHASYGLPVVLSTGMSTLEEVHAAVDVLREHGAGKITVLHCNTQYPTPFADVNLRAMPALGESCHCDYGYSDHTLGIEIPIAAVAMGATVIEKHFTLDRGMEGPDHRASLEPGELAAMVSAIRNVEVALGSAEKGVSASELSNRSVARKSIVAATHIEKGDILTEENLTTKRPGDGLDPMMWPKVLGTKAIRSFEEDERIEL